MSNYRVRQVLKLHLRDRQEHFLLGLATFLTDDTRIARVGFGALMEAADQARNTARLARRELEADGMILSVSTGVGRGKVTKWTALCLPEVSPETVRAGKGVNVVNPVSVVDPLSAQKGVNRGRERGPTEPRKRGSSSTR